MTTTALSSRPSRPRSSTASVQALILACAVSAGVHAVLAPAHFHEGPALGLAFAGAALALAALAVGLDRRPQSRAGLYGAALLLGALIAGYLATRTATLPLLAGHSEPLDAVGVATKLIEAFGLALAVKSITEQAADCRLSPAEKGVQS